MAIVALEVGSPRPSKDVSHSTKDRYGEHTVHDIIRERSGWLVFFFAGLLGAAFVVEIFESVLKDGFSGARRALLLRAPPHRPRRQHGGPKQRHNH